MTPALRKLVIRAKLHGVLELARPVLVDPPHGHGLAPRRHRRLRQRPFEFFAYAGHRIRPYEIPEVVVAARPRPRQRRGRGVPERAAMLHPAGAAGHATHVAVACAAQHAGRRLQPPAEPAAAAAVPIAHND